MFRDVVLKYYDKQNDLSCSEAIVYAANEYYDLKLDEKTLRCSSAFGGGMWTNGICGASIGATAILGEILSLGRTHISDDMKEAVIEFNTRFKETLEINTCEDLKVRYKTPEKRCEKMMVTAADILEDILNKHDIKHI